jgi:CRISPR-associated protein Cas2
MYWVIAYDVSSNRRRTQVARRLERAGLRVQKSVFVVELSHRDLRDLVRQLGALIDPDTDQVAAWALSQGSVVEQIEAGFPGGPEFQQTVIW